MTNLIQSEVSLLRLDQVLNLVPVSKSTWWAGCAEGKFPKPIKLTPRITVWRSSDINKFIQEIEKGGVS
jgi:predicted DNA-binding transcriptional regulator AlpA